MIHAKFYRQWIGSTKTGARKRSITNLYFISEADLSLKFIEESTFKGILRRNIEHFLKNCIYQARI